jgi:hypothetical protein
MTQVWIVRHGTGLYVFKDLATAETSIRDAYKSAYSVERDEVADDSFTFTVTQDGRVQDRVTVNGFEVYESPTAMPHILFPEDEPAPRERVRKEF